MEQNNSTHNNYCEELNGKLITQTNLSTVYNEK